jgi:tetratricopeptide (TPR) repeat protein
MKESHEKKKSSGDAAPAPESQTKDITPALYLRSARVLLRDGKEKDAFVLLQQAAVQFPDHPMILSYFGCLQALVEKKYRSGIETCMQAITLLKGREEDEKERLYAIFYLNLGRAYLAARKKEDAINAFNKGIKYDSSNGDLHKELRAIGKRKRPAVSFLGRSNPINKYIGMILHARDKEPEKVRSRGQR